MIDFLAKFFVIAMILLFISQCFGKLIGTV